MSAEKISEYLSRLTGKNIKFDEDVQITSGQRARLYSWLKANGYSISSNDILRTITVNGLLNAAGMGRLLETPVIEIERAANVNGEIDPTILFSATSLGSSNFGIGVDLQEVDALIPYNDRRDLKAATELSKIFSPQEISYAEAQMNPASFLTAIFCIKEAIKKSGGPRYINLNFLDIKLEFSKDKICYPGFLIDFTYTEKYALAFCLHHSHSIQQLAKPSVVEISQNSENSSKPSKSRFWIFGVKK